MKSTIKVLLTQRDSGLMAQFREFIWQVKTALLSLKTSKTLADVYGYTFDPALDRDGSDIFTKPTRPAQQLPAEDYSVHFISKCNYQYYSMTLLRLPS